MQLTIRDINRFRKNLEAKLNQLKPTARVNVPGLQDPIKPQDLNEMVVGSNAIEECVRDTNLVAHQILRIQTALDRIASGEYGFCMNCEDEITKKRLDNNPDSLFCIGCQEKLDTGELPEYDRFVLPALTRNTRSAYAA